MSDNCGDKKILLSVADGPEGIEIYTSEDEGMVDWSPSFPAVYVVINTQDAMVKLGPFQLRSIYDGLAAALKPRKVHTGSHPLTETPCDDQDCWCRN